MNDPKIKTYIYLVVIFILILASIPFQNKIDGMRDKFRSVEETVYFSSSTLEKLSLGYTQIIADIYWLRALQYFGGRTLRSQNPDLLYKYFDILTDLDPKFVNAYRFGGTFLSEPEPIGLGDLEKGNILFEKGKMYNPDSFRLPLEQAFIYYVYKIDYKKAAELFKEASEKPGLSALRRATLKGMAASSLKYGGNPDLSRKIWKRIYETTPIPTRREFALRNINEIDTRKIEDRLTDIVQNYKKRHGKIPDKLSEIVEKGFIKRIPEVPVGGEFIIVDELESVRSEKMAEQELSYNLSFIYTRTQRFKKIYGRSPRNLEELKEFVEKETPDEFPPHPYGKNYSYNPETGFAHTKTESDETTSTDEDTDN